MARTFIRQESQIRPSFTYVDNVAPAATMESGAASIEDDLNNLRSIASLLRDVQTGAWYDDLVAPVTFESGAKRGVQNLNADLHDLERKRVLVNAINLNDVTVGAADNFAILTLGQVPSQNIAAIGAVTTLGTVAVTNGGFGAHALTELSGSSAISPKNLCSIVDGVTRDPILSSERVVYALFQTESATDGSTMTGTTPNRAQLSFVRINAAGNDLEACPAVDIQGKVINFTSIQRKALFDLTEQDFLRGADVDVPSSSTVTRQVAYDNQGATPVEVTTNSFLDINSAGLRWALRDLANAELFAVLEGSTGGTSEVQIKTDVDVFNVDAIVNDFNAGIKVRTGGTRPIQAGVTDGVIETTAGDLGLTAFAEFALVDGNKGASTFAGQLKLSDTAAEWSAYETAFGEVSLLKAITDAYTQGNENKTYANVTANVAADVDVSLADSNLDTALPDMANGNFLNDYDVYHDGVLLRPGANAAANNDYYPGTTLATAAKLKFEFKLKTGDVLCVVKKIA